MTLWSDEPRERLAAARGLANQEAMRVQGELVASSPMKPWPYGMPTVVNPFVVFLGPSPGDSPMVGDADYLTRPAYEAPTVGESHPKFHYEDPRGYWAKIRGLTVGLLTAFDRRLSADDCYALAGQLNLGIGAFGTASDAVLEREYVQWVPQVITRLLRPRFVVLVGLLSTMKGSLMHREAFATSGDLVIPWNTPDRVLPFRSYREKNLVFRIWECHRADGGKTTVISWPNHPSRSPMTNTEIWQASVSEAAEYLAAATPQSRAAATGPMPVKGDPAGGSTS